jgi:hypothetical protein
VNIVGPLLNPVPRDLVIAILGAGAALAGLILVFIGVLITTYQGVGGGLGPARPYDIKRLRWLLWISVGLFCWSLATCGLGLWWLAVGGRSLLYDLNLWWFVADLVFLALFAVFCVASLAHTHYEAAADRPGSGSRPVP